MENQSNSINTKLAYDLLDIIEKQDDMICKLKQTAYSLVNENLEKENMINVLMQQEECLY